MHDDDALGPPRRRGSFSARLRSDVSSTSRENDSDKDGFPCPRQIKPLLHFYKYLQPLPDGRKLQLQLPPTVVCDKKDGREEVLALHTDASGFVARDEKGPAWRKRLLSDFMGEDQQNAASLLSVGMDDVVAVRNVAHWKSAGTSGVNSKSLVLTRRAFDVVVNAPCDLALSIQKYVRCRGSNASIFRVTCGERENRRFAINIFDEKKIAEAPTGKPATGDRPQGTAFEAALRQMAQISPYYLVTSTSGADPKRQQEHARLPRIRGSPVTEGLQAVKRIMEHFTAQLPGIRVREITADFVKDSRGEWWFIRVMHFDACYRIEVPLSVQNNGEIDSASFIHDALRSKYFRQTLRTIAATPPGNCMVPQCSLCGCSCELPKKLREELLQLSSSISSESASHNVLRALSEFRMTLKMVVTTLFQLRQRGESLPLWEHAALLLLKNPVSQASEFTVCYLCYRVYKSQVALSRIALELNEAYGVTRPSQTSSVSAELQETDATGACGDINPQQEHVTTSTHNDRISILCNDIQRFDSETCVSLISNEGSSSRTRLAPPMYTPTKGADIDPTCSQLRLVFFFHELQDGGPTISATDFYLEYHLGQYFSRLDFDGNKRHTPNRWQLCEARVQYLFATTDGFGDYCNDKRIRIKLKTVTGDEYHGYTSLSLRPLLSASKWYSTSVQHETRVDYLLELKTDAFGLLTLKVTLGLLVDQVPLRRVREVIKEEDFLRERSFAVFWPPPWVQASSLPVPVDWVGALMPSEYVSVLPRPKRQNVVDRQRLSQRRSSTDTGSRGNLSRDVKSPSSRFAAASAPADEVPQPPLSDLETTMAAPGLTPAQRLLQSVCSVAKRAIFRLAGEVTTFPTILIGHILRHGRFISRAQRSKGVASWAEPASFHLTGKCTIDSLTQDMKVDSIGAMSVVGEILMVLARCKLVSITISVASLEQVIRPYWLLGFGARKGQDESATFESVSRRADNVSSQHRVVWNRAIRRCEAAHFCGEFRSLSRASSKPEEQNRAQSLAKTTYEEMDTLRHTMSYRVKMQAHLLCEVVEVMETADSGFIDIGELRSLHKCMQPTRIASTTFSEKLSFCTQEHLNSEDLDALSTALLVAQEATEAAFVESLMSSKRMVDALAEFDRFGAGTMNYDEFCELGNSVLRALCPKVEDETTCTVFCLRHGNTKAFASDRCCILCSLQFQDQEFLPQNYLTHGKSTCSSSDGGSDDENEDDVPAPPPEKAQDVHTVPASATVLALGNGESEGKPLDEKALRTTLQHLKAAEWHVRYSRNSLDRATLETLLSERRVSSATSGRRVSAASTASENILAPSFSVTDFVVEAEERKHRALNGIPQMTREPHITRKTKKKAKNATDKTKPKISKSSALHSTRLQPAHSLSTLLRMELEDASLKFVSSRDVTRSTRLVESVHRGETKRNKLDRLVMSELEDVKQRLARLLSSS